MNGDEARLAVTFPDGTEALIAYPAHLDLAQMGVQPDVDLSWNDRWVGAIVFSHGGPVTSVLDRAAAVHQSEDGSPVEEWTARPQDGRHRSTTGWLVFRLPSWTVHVPVNARMDPRYVIDQVRPYQTDEGFVGIDATQPAALAEGYGEAGGPQLAFGDSAPLPDYVRPGSDGLLINVAPSDCSGPSVQVHGSYGSACLDGPLFVNGTSFTDTKESRGKLAELVEGLRLVSMGSVP